MSLLSRDLNIGNLLDEIQVLKERIAILERTAVQLTSSKFILDHLNIGGDLGAGSGELSYAGDLAPYRNSTAYTGYVFVPLTTPLTSTSWDGDAYSTTAKTLIDLSSVFGAPAGIKAVEVRMVGRDSGSSAADVWFGISPNNTAGILSVVTRPNGLPDNYYYESAGICPCNADGDIYYQIQASGSGTFGTVLEIWGYWI